jgi:predicted esterase
VNPLRRAAQKREFNNQAVDSRGGTWDAVRSSFGSDVAYIDRALRYAFERCVVDAGRIAVEGFSDGASYALGLGLPNGDLFRSIIAFSPGMIPTSDDADTGKPPIFISHGTRDQVLRIERTSRPLVRGLRGDGYDVSYLEFDGPHTVPPAALDRALDWWLGPASP